MPDIRFLVNNVSKFFDLKTARSFRKSFLFQTIQTKKWNPVFCFSQVCKKIILSKGASKIFIFLFWIKVGNPAIYLNIYFEHVDKKY